MNTIYNHRDLMMQADEECIVIHNFGIQLIEMTREEFEALIAAYQADKEAV